MVSIGTAKRLAYLEGYADALAFVASTEADPAMEDRLRLEARTIRACMGVVDDRYEPDPTGPLREGDG